MITTANNEFSIAKLERAKPETSRFWDNTFVLEHKGSTGLEQRLCQGRGLHKFSAFN